MPPRHPGPAAPDRLGPAARRAAALPPATAEARARAVPGILPAAAPTLAALLLTALLLVLALTAGPAAAADDRAEADTTALEQAPLRQERHDIVFIHTIGSSADVWSDMLPYFQGGWRTWTYELPGHGHRDPLPGLTIASAAEDLRGYIEKQDIRYPVLVGHGMGGLIALRYTFDHPADVKRLVVIDAAPRQMATPEEKQRATDLLLDDYDRFVAAHFLNMTPDSAVTARIVDQALRTDPRSFVSLLMSSFDFDMTEELPRQSVPILVIGSELMFPDDSTVRQRLQELGFDEARTVSFKRMPRTGHFVMLEQPSYLASVIMAFSLDR